jgi:hypothetical protein
LQKASPYHLALITGILHDHALKAENRYIGDGDIVQINLSLDQIRAQKAALLSVLDGRAPAGSAPGAPVPAPERPETEAPTAGAPQEGHPAGNPGDPLDSV